MKTTRQLYRVEEGKVFSGVCAGISEYINMDAGLVRVLFVIVFIFSGFFPVVIAYIVLAMILPSKQEVLRKQDSFESEFVDEDDYTINEEDYKY